MRDLLEIKVEGPDRFCPSCGRLLVHVDEDGVMDIANATHVEVEQHGDETPLQVAAAILEAYPPEEPPAEGGDCG